MDNSLDVNIETGTHFRYKSEVDPRKTTGKGGYLNGKIQLPTTNDNLKVIISTYPDTSLVYDQQLIDKDPSLVGFHPGALHIVRLKENSRENAKEPIPNIKMYSQELHIIRGQVKIINRISESDDGRNIPAEDELLTLGSDNCIYLGKEDTNLKMVVIKPNTEVRSNKKDDITEKKMIADRISDPLIQTAIEKYFEKDNSNNKYRLRIKVDVFSLDSGNKLGSGLSDNIFDTEIYAMKIHDISNFNSCSLGGTKVIMVSEFKLHRPVNPSPVFQLWNHQGERINDEEEKELLKQPYEIQIMRDAIIFITPAQPNLEFIENSNYKIKLVARNDGLESISFDFTYLHHNENQYIQMCSSLTVKCLFCDTEFLGKKKLADVLDHSKPGSKRKIVTAKQTNVKQIRFSIDSKKSSLSLSPNTILTITSEASPGSGTESLISSEGVIQDWNDIDIEDFEKYYPSSSSQDFIEKDGLRTAEKDDTMKTGNTTKETENLKKQEWQYSTYVAKLRNVLLIFICVFLFTMCVFNWKPQTSSAELCCSVIVSLVISLVIYWLCQT